MVGTCNTVTTLLGQSSADCVDDDAIDFSQFKVRTKSSFEFFNPEQFVKNDDTLQFANISQDSYINKQAYNKMNFQINANHIEMDNAAFL